MSNSKEQLKHIIKTLQKQQESYNLEFKEAKSSLPSAFWETYSSFANTAGGHILLGIRENPWEISGVKNPDKILKDLCNTANNKSMVSYNLLENRNIQVHELDGKKIISIYIPELPDNKKPLYLRKNPLEAYIRINEGDYKITESDLKRFSAMVSLTMTMTCWMSIFWRIWIWIAFCPSRISCTHVIRRKITWRWTISISCRLLGRIRLTVGAGAAS